MSGSIGPMTVMFVVMGTLFVVAIIATAFAVFVFSGLLAVMAILVVGLLRDARPAWRCLPLVWLALAVLLGLTAMGMFALWMTTAP